MRSLSPPKGAGRPGGGPVGQGLEAPAVPPRNELRRRLRPGASWPCELHGLGNLTDAELDLYFDYFQRLSRDISRPDKVICFDVPNVDVLLDRIRVRGREEEKGFQKQFLRGLNGYYTGFPLVLSGWTK